MSFIDDVQIAIGKKKQKGQSAPSKKLLVVEDEPILREMYRDKFVHEGYEVFVAENGQVGLEKIISQKPDVVLLDLMMPVMDGETMLRKLRDLPEFRTMPVLVLTNAGEIENLRHAKLYYNALEFMVKSNVSLEEIVAKVNEYYSLFMSEKVRTE